MNEFQNAEMQEENRNHVINSINDLLEEHGYRFKVFNSSNTPERRNMELEVQYRTIGERPNNPNVAVDIVLDTTKVMVSLCYALLDVATVASAEEQGIPLDPAGLKAAMDYMNHVIEEACKGAHENHTKDLVGKILVPH